MNITKKLIITGALISTLAAAGAYACGPQGGGQRGAQLDPAQRFEYIFTQLNLSEDQRSEVLGVLENMQSQRDTQRSNMQDQMRSLSERPSVEEMQAIRDANRASMLTQLTDQLNTVLSADDTAAFIQYIEFHSQRGDNRGHGNGNGSGRGMQQNGGLNNPARAQ